MSTEEKTSGVSSKVPATVHCCLPVGTVTSNGSPAARSCSAAHSSSRSTVWSAKPSVEPEAIRRSKSSMVAASVPTIEVPSPS